MAVKKNVGHYVHNTIMIILSKYVLVFDVAEMETGNVFANLKPDKPLARRQKFLLLSFYWRALGEIVKKGAFLKGIKLY